MNRREAVFASVMASLSPNLLYASGYPKKNKLTPDEYDIIMADAYMKTAAHRNMIIYNANYNSKLSWQENLFPLVLSQFTNDPEDVEYISETYSNDREHQNEPDRVIDLRNIVISRDKFDITKEYIKLGFSIVKGFSNVGVVVSNRGVPVMVAY